MYLWYGNCDPLHNSSSTPPICPGATVLFEVDATDLHNQPDIKFFEFERVIFNFPLADRHNIKKNRALLSDFFSRYFVSNCVCVCVCVCARLGEGVVKWQLAIVIVLAN